MGDKLKNAAVKTAKVLIVPFTAVPLIVKGKFSELSGVWTAEKEAFSEAAGAVSGIFKK